MEDLWAMEYVKERTCEDNSVYSNSFTKRCSTDAHGYKYPADATVCDNSHNATEHRQIVSQTATRLLSQTISVSY